MSRDPTLERRLLDAIVSEADRRFALDAAEYPEAVERRLTLGAHRYGDAFVGRDNVLELLEETPDVGGYVLLELQRLRAEGRLDLPVTLSLLRTAVHGAAADVHARRAVKALRRRP